MLNPNNPYNFILSGKGIEYISISFHVVAVHYFVEFNLTC